MDWRGFVPGPRIGVGYGARRAGPARDMRWLRGGFFTVDGTGMPEGCMVNRRVTVVDALVSQPMMSATTKRDLFGGAIQAIAPVHLTDASYVPSYPPFSRLIPIPSDLRQVPDTQEVFLYQHSGNNIIIEILQGVEPSGLSEAIKSGLELTLTLVTHRVHRFHFDALAHDNDAHPSIVHHIDVIPNNRRDDTPPAVILSGEQYIQKFNREQKDQVHIFMALYRIEQKNVDLVVTFNVPIRSADAPPLEAEGLRLAEEDFKVFVRSLRIVDFGLFA